MSSPRLMRIQNSQLFVAGLYYRSCSAMILSSPLALQVPVRCANAWCLRTIAVSRSIGLRKKRDVGDGRGQGGGRKGVWAEWGENHVREAVGLGGWGGRGVFVSQDNEEPMPKAMTA